MPQAFIQKNTVYGNFHQNLKKFFDLFSKPFLTNQGKSKDL